MAAQPTSMRSDLGRVRGLGSARHGAGHWWAQRLTAVALVPLVLWFTASVIDLAGAGHGAVRAWLADPVVAVAVVLLLVALFHHTQLGLQVVIEDYVHAEWVRVSAIVLVKFAAIAVAAASVFAVLKIAFTG